MQKNPVSFSVVMRVCVLGVIRLFLVVHAVGTSGRHAAQRREYDYLNGARNAAWF